MHAKELDRAFDERRLELRRGYAVDLALKQGREVDIALHDRGGIVLFDKKDLRVLHLAARRRDFRPALHNSLNG